MSTHLNTLIIYQSQSCRRFSVRELSAVDLSFDVYPYLKTSNNVSVVFPTFLRTMTCSYKVNFSRYSSQSDRNGKERCELLHAWEFALNAHSTLYLCEDL